MKKQIFFAATAIVFFSVNTNVQAQNFVGGRLSLAFQNVSAPSLNGQVSFNTISTYTIGAVGEFALGPNLSVQPELNYAEKGFKVNADAAGISVFGTSINLGSSAVTSVKYIDVPVMLKYKFGDAGGLRWYVTGGPTFGYASSGSLNTYADVIIKLKLTSTPIDFTANGFNQFEVGGAIGGGLEIPVGDNKFFADVRYTHGFTDVYTVPVIGVAVRNTGFAIGVGYMVSFGK